MNQDVRFRPGAIREVGQILDEAKPQSMLLVTGGKSFQNCGAEVALSRILKPYDVCKFQGVRPNPRLEEVLLGVERLRRANCDLILAVGGGSVLDNAKLISIFAAQQSSPESIVRGQADIAQSGPPVIAVPTTAGSGGEATHFAVVYLDYQSRPPQADKRAVGRANQSRDRKEAVGRDSKSRLLANVDSGSKKYSVASQRMLPRWAIIDPQLTDDLPPIITATSGLDAFCQAVESLWSVGSTDESTGYASEAVCLVLDHLTAAVHWPSPQSRQAMCHAAHLAGKAINITKTTAPHALSYSMTSNYGVSHGHAVALTLGEMLVYNSKVTDDDVADPRGATYVRAAVARINRLLGCENAEASREKIRNLVASVNLPLRLTDVGIRTAADRIRIAREINVERLANTPRRLQPESALAILEAIA